MSNFNTTETVQNPHMNFAFSDLIFCQLEVCCSKSMQEAGAYMMRQAGLLPAAVASHSLLLIGTDHEVSGQAPYLRGKRFFLPETVQGQTRTPDRVFSQPSFSTARQMSHASWMAINTSVSSCLLKACRTLAPCHASRPSTNS